MQRRNHSRFRTFISSPFTLVAVVVVLVVVTKAAWSIRAKAVESTQRLEVAQAEYIRMEENKQAVAGRVERLSSTAGIRAEVRDKYHAVEPGESVAVIVDLAPDRNAASAVVAAASSTPAKQGFWRWFTRIFSRD